LPHSLKTWHRPHRSAKRRRACNCTTHNLNLKLSFQECTNKHIFVVSLLFQFPNEHENTTSVCVWDSSQNVATNSLNYFCTPLLPKRKVSHVLDAHVRVLSLASRLQTTKSACQRVPPPSSTQALISNTALRAGLWKPLEAWIAQFMHSQWTFNALESEGAQPLQMQRFWQLNIKATHRTKQ